MWKHEKKMGCFLIKSLKLVISDFFIYTITEV